MKKDPSVFWGARCLAFAAGGIYWIMIRQGPVRHALSALKSRSVDSYYDMHGNGCEEIRLLMKAQFTATSRLCDEIDDLRGAKEIDLTEAFYDILGFVKDPTSIPWLESHLGKAEESFVYKSWLPRWRSILDWDVSPATKKWLTGAGPWAAFFRRWVLRPDAAGHRRALLRVMVDWFHDPATVDLFAALEGMSGTEGEDLLQVQLYLQRHGRPIDLKRLQKTITDLDQSPGGAPILTDYAGKMRNEEFVSWLIVHAEDKEAQEALQSITFVWNLSGEGPWKAWMNAHGNEGRIAWLNAAVREFESDLSKDEFAAAATLGRAIYRWDDLLLLPAMTRWATRPALGDEILGWIHLSYEPPYRERLRRLASEVLRTSPHAKEGLGGDLLRRLGFLDDSEDTWDRFVDYSNRRI